MMSKLFRIVTDIVYNPDTVVMERGIIYAYCSLDKIPNRNRLVAQASSRLFSGGGGQTIRLSGPVRLCVGLRGRFVRRADSFFAPGRISGRSPQLLSVVQLLPHFSMMVLGAVFRLSANSGWCQGEIS